ncbi:MAG: enoyl-CoA hydratase-related protein [Bacteriovoracaceae bacterium]
MLDVNKNENGIVTITLNRPDLHNAFNEEMILGLISEFEKVSFDSTARVVVLKGNGPSFCAGADLNWMKKTKSFTEEENLADSLKLAKLFQVINDCELAVVAVVHGAALGGGVGLVAACDHVIALDSVKFGLTEVRLGLVPAVISPYVIRKIGESNARSLFLSGRRFSAEEALKFNLIHEVCASAEDLNARAQESITDFLSAAPQAQKQAKKLIRIVTNTKHAREEINVKVCEIIAKVRTSSEGQEGMEALLNKRTPKWQKK